SLLELVRTVTGHYHACLVDRIGAHEDVGALRAVVKVLDLEGQMVGHVVADAIADDARLVLARNDAGGRRGLRVDLEKIEKRDVFLPRVVLGAIHDVQLRIERKGEGEKAAIRKDARALRPGRTSFQIAAHSVESGVKCRNLL